MLPPKHELTSKELVADYLPQAIWLESTEKYGKPYQLLTEE
jgi:hypothetical protein